MKKIGIFRASDFYEDVWKLYREGGLSKGRSTLWAGLDELYTVFPGQVTVVTGYPGAGKSNFLDCLLVNLCQNGDFRVALFSPENYPTAHQMSGLCEKFIRKPARPGPTPPMTVQELSDAVTWVNEHFLWIDPPEDQTRGPVSILAEADIIHKEISRLNGLVIDPWNELEQFRQARETETEYIGRSLSEIRRFARTHNIHVWIVVHPTKMDRMKDGKYPVPTLWDCAGSAHWRNKSDNGIVVWRDLTEPDAPAVDIHVQKIRFRNVGHRGMMTLFYEPVCATYSEEYGGYHV